MTEKRYFWYIPGNNEIVQEHGTFTSRGLFESRSNAIAYIEEAELDRSPDEVYLVEAEINEKEDAAVYVGHDWDSSTSKSKGDGADGQDAGSQESNEEYNSSTPGQTHQPGYWLDNTLIDNLSFLQERGESEEIEIPVEQLSNIESWLTDSDAKLDEDTASELCSLLTGDRTTWDEMCRAAANAILAEISQSFPELIEDVLDVLISDLDEALSTEIEDHPGYGLVVIPEYGYPAAIALSRYSSWQESPPSSFVHSVVNPGRIKRADFIVSGIVENYPDFVNYLYDYEDGDDDTDRYRYRLLGIIARGEVVASDHAWDLLLDDLHPTRERNLLYVLRGIKKATLSRADRIQDITTFLDLTEEGRLGRNSSREVSSILSHVVEDQPKQIAEMGKYLSNDGSYSTQTKAVVARALSRSMGDVVPYLPDPDEWVSQLNNQSASVAEPLSSLLETIAEDNPSKIKSIVPELEEVLQTSSNEKLLENVLKTLLPVSRENPEAITSEVIEPFLESDVTRIRSTACEILGYAGPPQIYEALEPLQEDTSESVKHAVSHAITRLEARFPELAE